MSKLTNKRKTCAMLRQTENISSVKRYTCSSHGQSPR